MKVKLAFGEYDCILSKERYINGRTALRLFETETGEPFTHATVNLPEVPLWDNQILIRNTEECEGMLQTLIDNNVVIDTGKTVQTGFIHGHVCLLNPESEWSK